jgi:hypothetical protein
MLGRWPVLETLQCIFGGSAAQDPVLRTLDFEDIEGTVGCTLAHAARLLSVYSLLFEAGLPPQPCAVGVPHFLRDPESILTLGPILPRSVAKGLYEEVWARVPRVDLSPAVETALEDLCSVSGTWLCVSAARDRSLGDALGDPLAEVLLSSACAAVAVQLLARPRGVVQLPDSDVGQPHDALPCALLPALVKCVQNIGADAGQWAGPNADPLPPTTRAVLLTCAQLAVIVAHHNTAMVVFTELPTTVLLVTARLMELGRHDALAAPLLAAVMVHVAATVLFTLGLAPMGSSKGLSAQPCWPLVLGGVAVAFSTLARDSARCGRGYRTDSLPARVLGRALLDAGSASRTVVLATGLWRECIEAVTVIFEQAVRSVSPWTKGFKATVEDAVHAAARCVTAHVGVELPPWHTFSLAFLDALVGVVKQALLWFPAEAAALPACALLESLHSACGLVCQQWPDKWLDQAGVAFCVHVCESYRALLHVLRGRDTGPPAGAVWICVQTWALQRFDSGDRVSPLHAAAVDALWHAVPEFGDKTALRVALHRDVVTEDTLAVVAAAVGQQPMLDMKAFCQPVTGGAGTSSAPSAIGLVRAAAGVDCRVPAPPPVSSASAHGLDGQAVVCAIPLRTLDDAGHWEAFVTVREPDREEDEEAHATREPKRQRLQGLDV